jgi:hypothetical protein
LRIGILERNRAVGQRIARVVTCFADLADVVTAEDPGELRERLSPDARLLFCSADDLDIALGWAAGPLPDLKIAVWAPEIDTPLLAAVAEERAVVSVLGWPSFLSMPRPWELGFVARTAGGAAPTTPVSASGLIGSSGVVRRFRPVTSADRDDAVAQAEALALSCRAPQRTAAKVAETAHELLMNAMYDAPVNHYGEPRYAFDRRQDIRLDEHEVPTATFASDGTQLVYQVNDPFGRLQRSPIFSSVLRGRRGAGEGGGEVVDASHGGAGLGFARLASVGVAVVAQVIPFQSTTVSVVFHIDVTPREARSLPVSMHLAGCL